MAELHTLPRPLPPLLLSQDMASRIDPAEQAFDVFKAAAQRAHSSLSLNDARQAGLAWADFLDLFVGMRK